jgi:predicted nucleic acid-binding protein
MIIVDTNVVSEPLKLKPDDAVLAWLDRQVPETLYLTTTSLSELLSGIEKMSKGKRQSALRIEMLDIIKSLFGNRILPFGYDDAINFAILTAKTQAKGVSISVSDGQIAAIGLSRGYAIATRDESTFLATGLTVINPWLC